MNVSPTLSALDALAIIRRDYPDFEARTARWLENGWDNRVLDVDDRFIFRFPREADFPTEIEQRVLALIRDKVAPAIPEPRYFGSEPVYMGYRKIHGDHWNEEAYLRHDHATRDRLARDIAEFLWAVHCAVKPAELVAAGLRREDWRARFARELEVLDTLSFPGLSEFAREAHADYSRWEGRERELALLFNDLHDENMLLDARLRLTGVIDFGDVAFGDVHWEFRYLFWLTEDLLERTLKAYAAVSGRELDVRAIRLCGVVQGLCELALAHRDPNHRVPLERTRPRVRSWIERGPRIWREEARD